MWNCRTIYWKQVPSVEKRYHFPKIGTIKGAEIILKRFCTEFWFRKWFPFSTYWSSDWLEIFFCFDFMVHFFAWSDFWGSSFLWCRNNGSPFLLIEEDIFLQYFPVHIFYRIALLFLICTFSACFRGGVFGEEKGADKMIQKNGTCFLHINLVRKIPQNWDGTLFLHF